ALKAALPLLSGPALALLLLLSGTAQGLAQGAAPTPASKPSPPAEVAPTTEELQRLVGALQDDAQRNRLIEQLQGRIAPQRGVEAEEASSPSTLLGQLSSRLDGMTGELLEAATVVVDLPRLFDYVRHEVDDAATRERLLEAAVKLGIIFSFALVVE